MHKPKIYSSVSSPGYIRYIQCYLVHLIYHRTLTYIFRPNDVKILGCLKVCVLSVSTRVTSL